MSNVEPNTIQNAYTQFGMWLKEQPLWIQDAVWRIYTGKKIDNEQIALYAQMCIDQASGKQPVYNHLDVELLTRRKSSQKISVLSLKEIHGVNALAENANLDFSEDGVTVIYGLNGAGKSGFMRIFKELSNSPHEEPIQPNVFKKCDRDVTPSCKIVILQEGEVKEKTYSLQRKPIDSLLSVCDVFDTRISGAYIAQTNNVSYQPFVFNVLSELARISDKIMHQISVLISTVPEKSVRLPDDLREKSDLKWLIEISKDTEIPKDCLEWSEEKEKEVFELKDSLNRNNVQQQLNTYRAYYQAVEPIYKDLSSAITAYNKDEIDDKFQKLILSKQQFELAQKLFLESADKQDKISANTEIWKSLWKTAKEYYESFLFSEEGLHFGKIDSVCPLCHQSLTGTVQERFSRIDEYINGTFSSEYQQAKEKFKTSCNVLLKRQLTATIVQNALCNKLQPDDVSTVVSVYAAICNLTALQNEEELYNALGKVNLNKAYEIVEVFFKSVNGKIESLTDALKSESQEKMKARLEMLHWQKWVYENRELIQQVIENLRYIDKLNTAKKYATTNRITIEANKLADALITEAHIDRFMDELSRLAPNIKVRLEKAPSKKGTSPYKVSIAAADGKNYKPEDILSEGEQRIVALSAFFADATGREDPTPIIIDDPISSLDLNYEEKATQRMVELAKSRQVIVFTHRISLLVGISEVCKKTCVPMKEVHIRSTMRGKGLPDFEDLYHGKLVAQLNGLKVRIQEARKKDVDSEEYADCIGRICQQFRICVERSVEDVLLLGMVHRFERRIMTNNMVMKLTGITEEDCKTVDNMMSKYSFVEHSQPMEALPVQYSIEEIEQDISMFSKWVKSYKKKQEI